MLENIRKSYVEELNKSSISEVKMLANYIQNKDKDGKKPCWGRIVTEVDRIFSNTDLKISLWKDLVRISEENALLLFIQMNKESEDILNEVINDVELLPKNVQKALVALNQTNKKLDKYLPGLSEEVKHFSKAGSKTIKSELKNIEQRLNRIHAIDSCLEHAADNDHHIE